MKITILFFLIIFISNFSYSQVEKKDSLKEPVVKKKSIRVSFQTHLLSGHIYFGENQTAVLFSNNEIEIQSINLDSFFYGIRVSSLSNNASINLLSIDPYFGYKENYKKTSFGIDFGFGITNYKEISKLQNIDSNGLHINSKLFVSYNLYKDIDIFINYKYYHAMFTTKSAYWGSDIRRDLVFDFYGFGYGIGWSF